MMGWWAAYPDLLSSQLAPVVLCFTQKSFPIGPTDVN
jgi:hypothetical protein